MLCVYVLVYVHMQARIPAAVLVLAELHNVASNISELQVGVAVVPEVLQQAAPA